MRCERGDESSIADAGLSDVSDAGKNAAGMGAVDDVTGSEFGFEKLLFAEALRWKMLTSRKRRGGIC
jgi:hypothetical protein